MRSNFEKIGGEENDEKMPGVKGVEMKNNHFVVSIVWKNGEKSVKHFPGCGFVVVNPNTNEKIGHITGEEAVRILKENVSVHNREDFSWVPFIV